MKTEIAGIIPARFASSRFPGKPLHPIAGKPLLQHVWEQCSKARNLERLIVATDDIRIAEAARSFGAHAEMTSLRHRSGTDRIAEIARRFPSITHFINIQGDEPLIDPRLIDRLAREMVKPGAPQMVTAANEIRDFATLADQNAVKVVVDRSGYALYFSRAPIPFARDILKLQAHLDCFVFTREEPLRYLTPEELPFPALRHHGIYGYSRDLLLHFVRWRPSPLERLEQLEQLRALENGVRIKVIITPHASIGVDTPEDAETVSRILLARG